MISDWVIFGSFCLSRNCSFFLSCSLYWQKAIHNIPWVLSILVILSVFVGSVVISLHSFLVFVIFYFLLEDYQFYWSQRIRFWFYWFFHIFVLFQWVSLWSLLFPFSAYFGFNLIFFFFFSFLRWNLKVLISDLFS